MSDYIQLRDGLAIYKQKQSKNYYVYLRQKDDAGKYFEFRKSSRTDDRAKATEVAYGYFFSYTQKLSPEVFESNSKSKVLSICNEVLSILDKQTKESLKRSPQSAAYATCIRNQIIPILPKSLVIKKLDRKLVKEILNQAASQTKRRNLSKSLSLIFDYAVDEELISRLNVPEISTDSKLKKAEPRRSFKDDDYIKIVTAFPTFLSASGLKPETKEYRYLLMKAFDFLNEVGCRPGQEIDNLTYSNIKNDNGLYTLDFNGTKTDKDGKSRSVVIVKDALMCIVHIHEHFYPDLYSHLRSVKSSGSLSVDTSACDEEFIKVFFEQKFRVSSNHIFRLPSKPDYALDWTKYFGQLMKKVGLDYVLYSCRHTFITKRLIEGKSKDSVALYCGTSADMIDKYYSDVSSLIVSSHINEDRSRVSTERNPLLTLSKD